jgi:alpha-mannosidase
MAYPRVAHIVSHTHWDREWYLPFHSFRVRLCEIVRRVLSELERNPSFQHFLLDGQAVILEDYLQIHPEDEARIRGHVESGRLSIGPWFILPDEFLVSAEAMVRNVLIGHKVCARFGGASKVGYMPDSFGHVAQMPQLLRQAGVDSFIYWRGNGDELDKLGLEYTWQAPDGSEVLAINQWSGYCNAAGLGFAEIWHSHTRREIDEDLAARKVRELFAAMAERSSTDVALLNNGCDHFPPQKDFARILGRLRREFPGVAFRHGELASFLRDVRSTAFHPKRFQGELLSGKHAHILSGVWSARMYLKQLNDRCQMLLAGRLEPLSAYTHFMHGRDYPAGQIEYTWKLLLQNHPHDSICGCSVDEVHADMLPRFAGVAQTAEESITRQMESLAPEFGRQAVGDKDTVLCIANTLLRRRTAIIERLVILQPCCADVSTLRLLDPQGREVPSRIIDVQHVERFWGVDYRLALDSNEQLEKFETYRKHFGRRILKDKIETELTDRFVQLQFLAADVPAVGHVNYRLTDAPATAAVALPVSPVTLSETTLENQFCRVLVHRNGTFDLTDKSTGRTYSSLNLLEDTEDVGDEYDYSPCRVSRTVSARNLAGNVRACRDTGLVGALDVAVDFAIPTRINADRQTRSDEAVVCPVRIRIGLTALSPVVDIDVLMENRAADHRLRALFPASVKTDSILSDGHFYTNVRSIDRPSGIDWVQPSPRTYPQQDFSLLHDARGGLAVFNRGLPEIEPLRDNSGAIGLALTLLRCVGWLSRDDFPTRRCQNAGPTVATPDAQCAGVHRFHYAVMPFADNWIAAGVKHASSEWRNAPLVVQGVEDLQSIGGEGLVESASNAVCVTAIKKHEERDSLIVRLYNLCGNEVDEMLRLGRPARAAWLADLLEHRVSALPLSGPQEVRVRLGAYQIATVEIEFTDQAQSAAPRR